MDTVCFASGRFHSAKPDRWRKKKGRKLFVMDPTSTIRFSERARARAHPCDSADVWRDVEPHSRRPILHNFISAAIIVRRWKLARVFDKESTIY